MCRDIGIPKAPEKTCNPTYHLFPLWVTLWSNGNKLLLEKLNKCQRAIKACLKHKVQLRALQSVIGTQNYACGAVVLSRPFLCRLTNLTTGIAIPHFYISITEQLREDPTMWLAFLSAYNGNSLLPPERWLLSLNVNLFIDTLGFLGFALVLGPQWFYSSWD